MKIESDVDVDYITFRDRMKNQAAKMNKMKKNINLIGDSEQNDELPEAGQGEEGEDRIIAAFTKFLKTCGFNNR